MSTTWLDVITGKLDFGTYDRLQSYVEKLKYREAQSINNF